MAEGGGLSKATREEDTFQQVQYCIISQYGDEYLKFDFLLFEKIKLFVFCLRIFCPLAGVISRLRPL